MLLKSSRDNLSNAAFQHPDIHPHAFLADTFKEAVANWKKLPDAERKAYTENFKVQPLCCILGS